MAGAHEAASPLRSGAPAGAPSAALRYRPEIDGLRAVAVLPVVLFHAGLGPFRGGFVGVDVFFVISGYLITGILLADQGTMRAAIAHFYARRARRILPALFLVLGAALPFAWWLMTPGELARFSASLLAVLGFASNVLFWREEGYFGTAAGFKPLLHTWSLAVEEQFYLVFPLVLLPLRRLAPRRLAMLLVLAALAGFGLCEVASRTWPTANFYLAPTRAWELLAGAACAAAGRAGLDRQGATRTARTGAAALAWFGLALILWACVRLDGSVPFPSRYALLPVGGALLVIRFARGGEGVGRLLASRPLVGIGLVSYSLYLWHQPLFAFARLARFDPPPPGEMAALAALSAALAVLSWRLVESPFRRAGRSGGVPGPRALIFAIAAAGALALAGAIGLAGPGAPWRFAAVRAGAAAPPAILAARRFVAPAAEGGPAGGTCRDDGRGIAEPCLLAGSPGQTGHRVALFGDSHAGSLVPAARLLPGADPRIAGLWFSSAGGCPPLLDTDVAKGNFPAGICPALARRQLDAARALHLDTVLLAGRWTLYAAGDSQDPEAGYLLTDRPGAAAVSRADSRRVLAAALARTVSAYRAAGIRAILIASAPQQEFALDRVLAWLPLGLSPDGPLAEMRRRAVTVAAAARIAAPAEAILAAEAARGTPLVRLAPAFRAGDHYLWGDAAGTWYRDNNHLSAAGARRTVPLLTRAIEPGPPRQLPNAANRSTKGT